MPERRQKATYLLHSTPQEEPFERFKRKAAQKMQNDMGRSIEEINEKSGVTGAYQGDILLTKDELEKMGIRSKRQAMRDLSRRWSNNTLPYIFYHPEEKAKDAFKKAAQLWNDNTCIDFKEYPDPMTTGIKPRKDVFRTSVKKAQARRNSFSAQAVNRYGLKELPPDHTHILKKLQYPLRYESSTHVMQIA
ncbi:hypothetical protein OSTOST_02994 [Ostertagia ostertagi]